VSPSESLLTVLVFRGGPLARAGHNHVIASHELTGIAIVPDDVTQASFEIHVPVQTLTIDEPPLRALEGKDFSAEVPDSAREGTQRNMLSEPMLDGERFPEILMKSAGLVGRVNGAAATGELVAAVDIGVRGKISTVSVPLRYRLQGDALRVQGELALKQTDLGLTPFSLFGGALRVEDEMRVKVSLVARVAE
jgi:hypothetical protein